MTQSKLSLPEGVRWTGDEVHLNGPVLDWLDALDRTFLRWAQQEQATRLRPGSCLSNTTLARMDWFESFPQLAVAATSPGRDPEQLRRLAPDPTGQLTLQAPEPSRSLLTPAACYHVYHELEGRELSEAAHWTLRARCFRRESSYTPLRRQRAFEMRELVCLGLAEECRLWLDRQRSRCEELAQVLGLGTRLVRATDPFFEPRRSAAHALQLAAPLKTELVTPSGLAIASFNRHHAHFGQAFAIQRAGQAAHSACAAFGLERWLGAAVEAHGPDTRHWPSLAEPAHV